MKRSFLTLSVLLGLTVLLTSGVESDNGKAGRTGSPSESTCHSCHDSFTQNTGGGSVTLGSTNMVGWEYQPGTVYHMTATVARSGNPLFGIGLEALTSANQNAGTLTATTSSVQIKNATVSGVSRHNIVHTLNGGASTDSKTFSFDWTAPTSDVGNVTFYFAGVAANNSGTESGDYVYTNSQAITPTVSTGIEEVASPGDGLTVFPDPIQDQATIRYTAHTNGPVTMDLYDVTGHWVRSLVRADRSAGSHTEAITGLEREQSGAYILVSTIDNQAQATRLVLLGAR